MSEEQGKPDTRGTIRDWPAWVVLGGVVIWLYIAAQDRKPTWVLFALIAFGAVSWLLRRGSFNPRR